MTQKKKSGSIGSWRLGEGGYEITGSSEIISKTLAGLKTKRVFVSLLHKGYQSGNTIIVGVNSGKVLIDKPVDWPGISNIVRVVFKDETNVWNHFKAKIVNTSHDTLTAEVPEELFRLQRRRHFRIMVSRGSLASFSLKGKKFINAAVVDISVGGLLLSLDGKNTIVGADLDGSIEDIVIQMAADNDDVSVQNEPITVGRGRIAREILDENKGCLLLGIELFPEKNEEKELLRYVRLRELKLLRKGANM